MGKAPAMFQITTLVVLHQSNHATPQPGRRVDGLGSVATQFFQPLLARIRTHLRAMATSHDIAEIASHFHRLALVKMVDSFCHGAALRAAVSVNGIGGIKPSWTASRPNSRQALAGLGLWGIRERRWGHLGIEVGGIEPLCPQVCPHKACTSMELYGTT